MTTEATGPFMSYAAAMAAVTQPSSTLEIEEQDVNGIRMKVWKAAPVSLRIILELTRLHGDKPYLVYRDEHLSYAEHYSKAASLAHHLVDEFGIKKGDRVALVMRNFPEWVISFWAATAVGAIVVPLNAWWTAPELTYGLADSGARVVIADQERYDLIHPHLPEIPAEHILVARGELTLPSEVGRLEDIIARPAHSSLPAVEIGPEDDATIFYTSGTSGQPKGALGTHRNICTNLMNIGALQAASELRLTGQPPVPTAEKDPVTALTAVPFFHVTGCHAILVAITASGNKLVIMHRWNAEQALELIEREKVTNFTGVPTMAWQMLESPDFARRDTSSLVNFGTGGAPSSPELVKTMRVRMSQSTPTNGYGLTETSAVVTANVGGDYESKGDSIGVATPVNELRIVGGDGQDLPAGEIGELWIKGPNVVKGYWNKPEATADAFSDGWFRTGDLAKMDAEGFVYIVDRAKDMVIRGGENVYCVEVENALYSHPDIMDAAVFGIPHRTLGEEVAAAVHLVPGTAQSEDNLKAYLSGRIAAFKVPVLIRFFDEPLLRNANGKIVKREIRAQIVAASDSD